MTFTIDALWVHMHLCLYLKFLYKLSTHELQLLVGIRPIIHFSTVTELISITSVTSDGASGP